MLRWALRRVPVAETCRRRWAAGEPGRAAGDTGLGWSCSRSFGRHRVRAGLHSGDLRYHRDLYLVLSANAFALLGLRALYFLLIGLLDRLVHLNYGLAIVLAFIGVKLVLHYLHTLAPAVPQVPTGLSLLLIATTLTVTTATSLHATRRGVHRPPSRPPGTTEPARRPHQTGAQATTHGGEDGLVRRRCCRAAGDWLRDLPQAQSRADPHRAHRAVRRHRAGQLRAAHPRLEGSPRRDPPTRYGPASARPAPSWSAWRG